MLVCDNCLPCPVQPHAVQASPGATGSTKQPGVALGLCKCTVAFTQGRSCRTTHFSEHSPVFQWAVTVLQNSAKAGKCRRISYQIKTHGRLRKTGKSLHEFPMEHCLQSEAW